MVFGDHKQGKKTALNQIIITAKEKFYPEFVGCHFKELKTSCVQLGSIGNLTLINTPATSNPIGESSDDDRFIEIIRSISIQLNDPNQGISSLIQCIKVNSINKIGLNTVRALMNAFSIFHSLNSKTDMAIHPRYHIIVNDMSKHGKEYDPV